MKVVKYGLAVILLALFTSCAESPLKPDADVLYKRDMSITIDGFQGEGTLVVPKKQGEVFKFDIIAKGEADLFTVESCHREMSWENAGQKGFFANKKRVTFDFDPINNLETNGSCLVRMGAYTKGGRHSWGIVDFEGQDATLPATVRCNGSNYQSRGVTVCQAKAGLLQEIIFPEVVAYSPDPNCPMPASKDGKIFRFEMIRGECSYAFIERAGAHRVHRLTTVGYDQVLIRGN